MKTQRGAPLKWVQRVVSITSADCTTWPFSRYKNGYGQVWFRGRLTPAHRAVCILAHGEPPTSQHQAAHSCGTRDCCNPLHIRWATQSENELDKRNHGTAQIGERNGAAKLREPQVSAIKAFLSQGASSTHLGRLYGVDRKTIDATKAERTWVFILPEYDQWMIPFSIMPEAAE